MAIISVPKPLREKLGEEGSDALIELINRQAESERGNVLEFVEEKFERRLSEEMAKMNNLITQEISSVNERISQEIGSVNDRISQEIGSVNDRISQEIGSVNDRISQAIGSVNERISETNERITKESSRLDMRISAVQATLIKWMFLFWIGQVGAILGILFAFFR